MLNVKFYEYSNRNAHNLELKHYNFNIILYIFFNNSNFINILIKSNVIK